MSQETAKEVEKIAYSFSSSTQSFTFSADEISETQLALIDSGMLSIANATDKVWDMDFGNSDTLKTSFEQTHGAGNDQINSLHADIRNHILDVSLSAGRFDLVDAKTQAALLSKMEELIVTIK